MAGTYRVEEFAAWQLSQEVKARVFGVLKRSVVAGDYDFCRQIRKSTRAAPALIAEGFARFRRREFIRYLELAIAELDETRNHLREGAQCGYFTVDEFRDVWRLCYRSRLAAIGLIRYLKSERAKNHERRLGSQPK